MEKKGVRTANSRHKLTREESSKGGKHSAEVRAARRTLREGLLAMLSAGNTQDNMLTALLAKALKGDIAAFTTVRDTIGEKPVEKKALTDVEGNDIKVPVVSNEEILAIMERRSRGRVDKKSSN